MNHERALEVISRYYDGCSTGDVDLMLETLHTDVVHYFLAPNIGSAPVAGGEHLARYWRKVTGQIHATWTVDHLIAEGDEAVIEWTMIWTPPGLAARVATRGAEWFRFEDDKIIEIRSYYQQRPASTELENFPYESRGYATLAEPSSTIHAVAVEEAS